jgi:hypothetical protein
MLDHVIPVSTTLAGKRVSGKAYAHLPRTPACKQCNSILGNAYLLTWQERKEFVAAALRKKLRSLKYVHWTEDELKEVGRLRSYIEAKNEEYIEIAEAADRAEFLQWIDDPLIR